MPLPATCRRYRRAAFVETDAAWGASGTRGVELMAVGTADRARWTFSAPAPGARSLVDIEEEVERGLREQWEREEGAADMRARGVRGRVGLGIGLQDKMGLFLSLCSVLVSIQMLIPRLL